MSTRRSGDPTEAGRYFEDLFDSHHDRVFRYCARRLPRPDADDAAAEVFATAWRRIDDAPQDDRAFLWLIGIAYKVIGNQYRSRARRHRLGLRLGGIPHAPEVDPEPIGGQTAVVGALGMLNSADQELIRLSIWDELSNTEIGSLLDISDNAVAQRLFRARSRFRRHYEHIRAKSGEEANS